ncbi:MAG: hypothetical protein ACRYGO_22630 [Janthinobacterium lividum]
MSLLDFFHRPPSRRRFAQLLLRELAAHLPDEPARFDETGFRLLLGADGEQVINLHNLYPEYCAAGKAERALQRARFLTLVRPSGIPPSFAEARAHLMPALRGRGMLEYLRLMELGKDRDKPSGFLFLPFSRDTALMLVYDGEQTMQSFGQDQLAQWGVSAADALAAAMDNLRDATVDRFVQPQRGVFMGAWNDAYDSSRLLLPDLAHRVAGANPLAMAPARGTLLLASGNDAEAVRAMIALARRVADEETRPVSALVYRFVDGRPVEYAPADVPAEAAARAALAGLERCYRYGDYAAQKETLDELHEQDGTDIFVAGYRVIREKDTGEEYSLCTWARGVDTLLPRTDRVALGIPGEGKDAPEYRIVPWDALHAACGHLMQPVLDAFPERYRVTAFPDPDVLRRLAPE